MELMRTLTATDRELLSRAVDVAANLCSSPGSRQANLCFVISRGLAPDTMDRDLPYLSALVGLAHDVGVDLASSSIGSFQLLGRDIIAFTECLQGRGKASYALASAALGWRVFVGEKE